jgi:hypothetical protein
MTRKSGGAKSFADRRRKRSAWKPCGVRKSGSVRKSESARKSGGAEGHRVVVRLEDGGGAETRGHP